MATSNTEIGKWVDRLFEDIFFQPDDQRSQKALEEELDPDFKIIINSKPVPTSDWKGSIAKFRENSDALLVSSRELLASQESGSGNGSVAHFTVFSTVNKETGEKKEESSVTMVTRKEKNGKLVLTELFEVTT